MGELADFHVSIKYRPQKVNIDADTLSRAPLDINDLTAACTEELSQEVVSAAWEGTRAARQKNVAWVAALLALTQEVILQPRVPLQEIKHGDLIQVQREDPTM